MPTKDPVRRRKQNRDNQKRWRERQTDQLHELQAKLREQYLRVAELEEQLRSARNQSQSSGKAYVVPKHSKQTRAAKQQSPAPEVAVPPELDFTAILNTPNVVVPSGMFAFDPSSNPASICHAPPANKAEVELNFFEHQSATAEHVGFPYNSDALYFGFGQVTANGLNPVANRLAKNLFDQDLDTEGLGYHHHSTYQTEQGSQNDSEQPMALSEMVQEGLKMVPPQQELDQLPHDPRFLYLDCAADWMMGGSSSLAYNMMAFPDDSVLSKHISVVQMVLHGNLHRLKPR